MKDYRIGFLTSGRSEFDDEIWKMLSEKHVSQRCFAEFNHLEFVECFIFAGADIKTKIEGDEVQLEIFIDPEGKPDFIARLGNLVAEKYVYLKGHRD